MAAAIAKALQRSFLPFSGNLNHWPVNDPFAYRRYKVIETTEDVWSHRRGLKNACQSHWLLNHHRWASANFHIEPSWCAGDGCWVFAEPKQTVPFGSCGGVLLPAVMRWWGVDDALDASQKGDDLAAAFVFLMDRPCLAPSFMLAPSRVKQMLVSRSFVVDRPRPFRLEIVVRRGKGLLK